jgi:hypothetical protein
MRLALLAVVLAACAAEPPNVRLVEDWPVQTGDYAAVTTAWTRTATLRGEYQMVADLSATFKSSEWRAAHAELDVEHRGLTGEARSAVLTAAQADAAGPYEVELLLTTWDRRENDLDRGKRSVWRLALLDEAGHEIAPIEIVKDKRPPPTVHAEFPALGDFGQAYIARFPRTNPVLGPNTKLLRLRMSSERGGLELAWAAP